MSPDVYGQLYPDVSCLMSTHICYILLVRLQIIIAIKYHSRVGRQILYHSLQIFKTGNQDHGIYFQIINLY